MIDYNYLYNKHHNSSHTVVGLILNDGSIKRYSYKDLFESAEKLYKKFIRLGISSSDKVILYSSDGPVWYIYYLTLLKLNADVILIDKNVTLRELNHLINKTNAKVICTEAEVHQNKFDIIINTKNDEAIINEKRSRGVYDENKESNTIIFSSGTSSTKTGIIQSTSNIFEIINYTKDRYKLVPKNKFITIVPCSHIYGLSINFVVSLLVGCEVYFLETLSMPLLLKSINTIKPDYIPGVPKIFDAFKDKLSEKVKLINLLCFLRVSFGINLGKKLYKQIYKYTGKKLCIVSAGSPLSKDTKRFYYGLGMGIIEFYGSTETGVPIIGTKDKNKYTHGSGTVVYPNEIKLSETNELLVKSKYSFIDYLDSSLNREELFTDDGWIKTGDLAKIKKGNVYITGRIKETILLQNGEKVSPNDIELFYSDIKGIKELAVVGVPVGIKKLYDQVHFFIVKDENVSEKEIEKNIIEVSKDMSINMRPKKIHYIDEMPKTDLGKYKRYILKNGVLEGKIK